MDSDFATDDVAIGRREAEVLAGEVDGGGADDETLAVLVFEPDIHLGGVVGFLLVGDEAVQGERVIGHHGLPIDRTHPG
jgi:hypothetical protein